MSYTDLVDIHLGRFLLRILLELGISFDDLAYSIDVNPDHLREVVFGKVRLTEDIAERLYTVTGVSPALWLDLDMLSKPNQKEEL